MMRSSTLALACLLAAGCSEQGGDGNAAAGGNSAGPAAAPAGKQAAQGQKTILETLTQSGEHGTLANAFKAAGLTETLSGPSPYTVFAPTDAAFEALPAGTANGLLAPDAKPRLVALLTGHIVPGVVTTADLGRAIDRGKGKAEMATVGGPTLTFTRDGGAIVVSDGKSRARIARADMVQANGVVQSLDAVLLPAG